jgi:hypothetical protein
MSLKGRQGRYPPEGVKKEKKRGKNAMCNANLGRAGV